jgi:hypothetical protein
MGIYNLAEEVRIEFRIGLYAVCLVEQTLGLGRGRLALNTLLPRG